MSERLSSWNDQSGHITVTLTLLFFLIMGVGFLVFGGMREYMKASIIQENMNLAGEDILAQYDGPLYERYHLFLMDPREKDRIVKDGVSTMQASLQNTGFYSGISSEFSLNWEKNAFADRGKYVLKQIKEWESCQGVYQLPEIMNQLLKSTNKRGKLDYEMSEAGKDTSENPESKNAGEENVEKTEEEHNEETEEEKKIKRDWKEWKAILEDIFQSGILMYVTDGTKQISNQKLSSTSPLPSKELRQGRLPLFQSDGMSFTTFSHLKHLYEQGMDTGKKEGLLSGDFYLIPYIMECFPDYQNKDKTRTHCLLYEKEYLIAGKKKDKDNLRSVADQIFLLRFFTNYAYAITDSEIKMQAESMALVLTGLLGFPQVEKQVAMLLIASLCYGESLLEVRALFHGQKVALWKNKQNWNLSFGNAMLKLKEKAGIVPVAKGANYEDYIMGLILLKSSSRQLLYRMMDLMQCNVALEEADFQMRQCIVSFQWTGTFTWNPMFRKIPSMGLSWAGPFNMNLTQIVTYQ